jgi:hypothetical protein
MLILTSTQTFAHEMTPTYPELRPSYIDGLYSAKMKLFNRRDDTIYYDIGVYDKDWNKLPFAAQDKLIKINYLERKDFEIFVRGNDYRQVEYICTTSKVLKSDTGKAAVMSRICSKIKRD